MTFAEATSTCWHQALLLTIATAITHLVAQSVIPARCRISFRVFYTIPLVFLIWLGIGWSYGFSLSGTILGTWGVATYAFILLNATNSLSLAAFQEVVKHRAQTAVLNGLLTEKEFLNFLHSPNQAHSRLTSCVRLGLLTQTGGLFRLSQKGKLIASVLSRLQKFFLGSADLG